MSNFLCSAITIIIFLVSCQSQPTAIGLEKLDLLPLGARAAVQPYVDLALEFNYEIVTVKPANDLLAFGTQRGDEIWCFSDKLQSSRVASTGLLIRNGDTWKVSSVNISDWNKGCK